MKKYLITVSLGVFMLIGGVSFANFEIQFTINVENTGKNVGFTTDSSWSVDWGDGETSTGNIITTTGPYYYICDTGSECWHFYDSTGHKKITLSGDISYLDLAGNNIISIDSIKGCSSLKEINLDNTQLTSIPKNIFSECQSLEKIHLKNSKIKEIASYTFSLPSLNFLDLEGNNIDTVESNAFFLTGRSAELNLSKNKIKTIKTKTFKVNGGNYSKINLCDNDISKIEPSAFSGSTIGRIDLDNNQLTGIEAGIFDGVKVGILSISQNSISTINKEAFDGITRRPEGNPTLNYDGLINLENNNLGCIPSALNNYKIHYGTDNNYTTGNTSSKIAVFLGDISQENILLCTEIHTVTISSNGNGTVSSGSVSANYGTTISIDGNSIKIGSNTIIATPNNGYSFSGWNNQCGDTITKNCSISASFSKNIDPSEGSENPTNEKIKVHIVVNGGDKTLYPQYLDLYSGSTRIGSATGYLLVDSGTTINSVGKQRIEVGLTGIVAANNIGGYIGEYSFFDLNHNCGTGKITHECTISATYTATDTGGGSSSGDNNSHTVTITYNDSLGGIYSGNDLYTSIFSRLVSPSGDLFDILSETNPQIISSPTSITVQSGSSIIESPLLTGLQISAIQIGSTNFTALANTSDSSYSYTFSGRKNTCGNSVTQDCTITAEFNKVSNNTNIYTISIKTDGNGTIQPAQYIQNYSGTTISIDENQISFSGPSGDKTIITAIPNSDTLDYTYSFSGWTNTCGSVLTKNCTITANFTSTKKNSGGTSGGNGEGGTYESQVTFTWATEPNETKIIKFGDDNKVSGQVDWGNGEITSFNASSGVLYTYVNSGYYEVTLKILDDDEFTELNISKQKVVGDNELSSQLSPVMEFSGTNHLKFLDLSLNCLGHKYDLDRHACVIVTNGSFEPDERTGMGKNFISMMRKDRGFNIPNLEYLNLSSNGLSWMEMDSFKKLPNLKKLNLENNYFYRINWDRFQGLSSLEDLNLQGYELYKDEMRGNYIRIIDGDFNNLSFLNNNVTITLSSNGLTGASMENLPLDSCNISGLAGWVNTGNKTCLIKLENNNIFGISISQPKIGQSFNTGNIHLSWSGYGSKWNSIRDPESGMVAYSLKNSNNQEIFSGIGNFNFGININNLSDGWYTFSVNLTKPEDYYYDRRDFQVDTTNSGDGNQQQSFTVSIIVSPSDYGTATKSSITDKKGVIISINDATLTIGDNTITANPKTSDTSYDYTFNNWTNTCGSVLTKNCTITANFTSTKKSSGGTSDGGGGGGGGGGGTTTKSNSTAYINSISVSDTEIDVNNSIDLIIKADSDYEGHINLRAQYRKDSSSTRKSISNTSSTYFDDESSPWRNGYYSMSSSYKGSKTIYGLVSFIKEGQYRIFAEDINGNEVKSSIIYVGTDNDDDDDDDDESGIKITASPSIIDTNERINLKISTNSDYTKSITFSKLYYKVNSDDSWTTVSSSSNTYISDFSDEWDSGSYKMKSSDKGNVTISQFLKFKKEGYYKIYAKDYYGKEVSTQVQVGTNSSNSEQLEISIDNNKLTTNDYLELTIKTDDNYIGKMNLKAKYLNESSEKWINIEDQTSSKYFSQYSSDWKAGYYKMTSSDDGEITLNKLVQFDKEGYYRIYVTDKNNNTEYVSLKVSDDESNKDNEKFDEEPEEIIEHEVYIARSCKQYNLQYSYELGVYTSSDLNTPEYFINLDYFKRYVDSKNKQKDGCPTNVGRISTSYLDKSDDEERFVAPNGKVYYITEKNGIYSSKQLSSGKTFSTLKQLKLFIRDKNPLIGM